MHNRYVGGWESAAEAQNALRGQLGKKKQFNAVQIGNMTRAIAEGRALDSLLNALGKLESQRLEIEQQLALVEQEIAQATIGRPQASHVQWLWANLHDLWDVSSEEGKAEMMQSIVQAVIVQGKSCVSLTLFPIPEIRSSEFVMNSQMGAGTLSVAMHQSLAVWLVRVHRLSRNGRRPPSGWSCT